jgi:hypothetical protein
VAVEKAMVVILTKMGATDKPVFGLTRVYVGLFKPITGSPRRLGLSVAPTIVNILLSNLFYQPPVPNFIRWDFLEER